MSSIKKYFIALSLLVSTAKISLAQTITPSPDTSGQIIMTGEELRSFIRKVAALKKQYDEQKDREIQISQLDKQIKLITQKNSINSRVNSVQPPTSTPGENILFRQDSGLTDERIYQEIGQINSRIDTLMQRLHDIALTNQLGAVNNIQANPGMENYSLQQQPVGNYISTGTLRTRDTRPDSLLSAKQIAGADNVQSQRIAKEREASPQIYADPVVQERRVEVVQSPPQKIYMTQPRYQQPLPIVVYQDRKEKRAGNRKVKDENDTAIISQQEEQRFLQDKIANLEEQINLLIQLNQGADTTNSENSKQYSEDITELSNQINLLTARLDEEKETPSGQQSDPKEASNLMKPAENSALLERLRELSTRVYFANNSSSISSNHENRLAQIADYAKNNPQTIIILRGFSSPVGNPQYNNRLALLRADNVKIWLLTNGLNPDQIIAVRQGIDDSVSDPEARRVEVTLMAH